MYFLGVEIGLTHTRSVVLNLDSASLEAEAMVEHEFLPGLPAGHREQDPSQWVRAVDQALRQCLDQLGEGRKRVVGIGVAGHPRAPVLLDRENCVIRATKVGGDRSTIRQERELKQAFGGNPGLIELTGNSVRAGSVAAKLLWLKQNEPHQFRRLSVVMMPHDFINYWLTGVKQTEFSEAAQTGLLEVRHRQWCMPLLEFVDPALTEMLPAVRSSRDGHGLLRGELAQAWGLREGIAVSAGGSLEMMSALAAGSVRPGSVTVNLAPQAGVAVVSDEPRVDPLGVIGVACDLTDRWVLSTKRIGAGRFLEEVRKHYGWSGVQLREAMMSAKDGAEGLLLMPGSREAGYRGTLYGINAHNYRAENVARAAVEALLLELSEGLAGMHRLGTEAKTVRMTGAGSGDAEVRQLVADALGLPVVPVSGEVSPAMGGALQAAWTFFHQSGEDITFEEITSYAVAPEEHKRSEPEASRHALYQRQLDRRRGLEEVLRGEEWPRER